MARRSQVASTRSHESASTFDEAPGQDGVPPALVLIEWSEQIRLTRLLPRFLPDNVFWSALESAPRSALAGYLAKKRGVKPGLPDIMVVHGGRVVFLER